MSVFSKHPFIVLWILLLPGASLWAAGKDTATRIPVLRDGSYSTQISPTQEVLTLRPGETRTFIKFFSFNTTTAASIFLVDAVSNLPDSITLGFNAGTVQGTTVTIQYRFTVADDATGGSFDVKVDFNFLNLSEEVVATGTVNHTIIIDAPAPVDDYGDDCASAASIDMGTSRTGEIFAGGDRDFFKIVAPAAGTIIVSTEGSTDTAGDLLDDGCMLIVSQDGGGKDSNSH